ncbi:hypothetical protein EYF80_037608 [Liparis tanakae]|uniref:Uncharacterized protein n=1 Tax=Liparis tanakae TaxID=230148 RepID=A0A4Z2GF56_9TELE|nr:hypothetical protein EYF80_037608 [Liparis tanakae]
MAEHENKVHLLAVAVESSLQGKEQSEGDVYASLGTKTGSLGLNLLANVTSDIRPWLWLGDFSSETRPCWR